MLILVDAARRRATHGEREADRTADHGYRLAVLFCA
jgi:hypothetical protein